MLVLFPHCDIHVALNGTPPLHIRVMSRALTPGKMSYTLTDVTPNCAFNFFAPYNPVGSRLQAFAAIDPATGLVTPNAVGVNLVQIHVNNIYLVARIQVHHSIQGWWFGNDSITTARDATFAHAQPSIYALFNDPAAAPTDLVGDITGHGYVQLQSGTPGLFSVNADGRLQGIVEGAGNLAGTFLGVTQPLPVKVVDYAKPRTDLVSVRSANRSQFATKHNMLFIPEGFRNTPADRERFDEIVTKTVDQMFSAERHAPYNILADSFNVWKAYVTSEQHAITCGYPVNEQAAQGGVLDTGFAIPWSRTVSSAGTAYSVDELVAIVGLPRRNETRTPAELKTLWGTQSLNNFDATRVDNALVEAWRVQSSIALLEARDTFFGLYLGARFADFNARLTAVAVPASDSTADAALAPFVRRVYEWFKKEPVRTLHPDPRRHPPELYRYNTESLGSSIMDYVSNLRDLEAPNANIGAEWMPDPGTPPVFRRSRGLVAIIANDGLLGGANINDHTMTTQTLNNARQILFASDNTANRRIRRRMPPDQVDLDMQECIDTVAHEFGHSFNLGDEYEDFVGDDANAFSGHDNVTALSQIFLDPQFMTNRKLDPNKVKWLQLVRIEVSEVLTAPSAAIGNQMRVTVDPGRIRPWFEAKEANLKVFLRHIDLPAGGQQLPQPSDPAHLLSNLDIGDIDEGAGTIMLGGAGMPSPPPTFPAGSLLFIPKFDDFGNLVFVTEKKVIDKLKATNLPLNDNPDRTTVNKEADHPVSIDDFKAPCKSYKLIGVFEGAIYRTGMTYRPAGLCKMRKKGDTGPGDGEFCHVCKYLIVNRVNPQLHWMLDKEYYPEAKKNE